MSKKIKQTNPSEEKSKGRIALWLDPNDIQWLSQHCCCSDDTKEAEKARCARIRFRTLAAIHKANLSEPEET